MATSDAIYRAVEKLGERQQETSTQVALVSQSVGELSSHVTDMRGEVREVRDRLTTVETRVYERTRPVKLPNPGSDPPPLKAARAKLLNAKAALFLALAGSIGAAITALVAWLTSK